MWAMTEHMLKVRLTAEELAMLDAEAKAKGRTRSQHVREMIRANEAYAAKESGKVRAT